jgi:hypothetical protein
MPPKSTWTEQAKAVAFDPSGLIIVKGVNVQTALTELDEYLANLEITGGSSSSGPAGESAYQSWLDAGHVGTESDFVTWLIGPQGPPGPPGDPGPQGLPGVDGVGSGQELYHGEITTTETATGVGAAAAVAFATTDLTYTIPNQSRPVLVHAHALVANATAGSGAAIYINGPTTGTLYARDIYNSPAAGNIKALNAFKRFPANSGSITIRLFKGSIVGGTASFYGALAPIFLRVVTL